MHNVPQGIGSTDHLSFIRGGRAGVQPHPGLRRLRRAGAPHERGYAERIDEQDLKQNAVVLAAFLYNAATRTEMIPSAVRK